MLLAFKEAFPCDAAGEAAPAQQTSAVAINPSADAVAATKPPSHDAAADMRAVNGSPVIDERLGRVIGPSLKAYLICAEVRVLDRSKSASPSSVQDVVTAAMKACSDKAETIRAQMAREGVPLNIIDAKMASFDALMRKDLTAVAPAARTRRPTTVQPHAFAPERAPT